MPSRLPVLLAALAFGAAPVRPAPRDAIEVRWRAPPECPDEARVRAAIERHVGRRLTEIHDRSLSIVATTHRAISHWSLTIFTVTPEGTQERSLRYSHGCSPLADAAAVLIAMTIDPEVIRRLDPAALELLTIDKDPSSPEPAPTPGPEPPPVAPAPAPAVALPPQVAAPPSPPPAAIRAPSLVSVTPRRRVDPRGAARIVGGLDYGDLPGVGGGLHAALALRLGHFQAEIIGGGWLPRSLHLTPGNASARFDLWTLGLRGGYVARSGRRLEIPLLVGLEAGQIHVRGVQLAIANDNRSLWFAITLSPGIAFVPRRFLAIVLGVDILIPATRTRFVVAGAVEIFRPQPAGVRAVLGLEFRFPTGDVRSP